MDAALRDARRRFMRELVTFRSRSPNVDIALAGVTGRFLSEHRVNARV